MYCTNYEKQNRETGPKEDPCGSAVLGKKDMEMGEQMPCGMLMILKYLQSRGWAYDALGKKTMADGSLYSVFF